MVTHIKVSLWTGSSMDWATSPLVKSSKAAKLQQLIPVISKTVGLTALDEKSLVMAATMKEASNKICTRVKVDLYLNQAGSMLETSSETSLTV